MHAVGYITRPAEYKPVSKVASWYIDGVCSRRRILGVKLTGISIKGVSGQTKWSGGGPRRERDQGEKGQKEIYKKRALPRSTHFINDVKHRTCLPEPLLNRLSNG